MVSSIRVLTCGVQRFCIARALLPFQLTHSNDVSSRFPAIQVDKDENIEKVMVETAGPLWMADVVQEQNQT